MTDEREWATCEICNTTTNPSKDPYGPRDNSNVRVVKDGTGPLGLTLAHGFCLEEGFQDGLEQYVAGGEA